MGNNMTLYFNRQHAITRTDNEAKFYNITWRHKATMSKHTKSSKLSTIFQFPNFHFAASEIEHHVGSGNLVSKAENLVNSHTYFWSMVPNHIIGE